MFKSIKFTVKKMVGCRGICFDEKIARKLFYRELKMNMSRTRTQPSSWNIDHLLSGSVVQVDGDKYKILCRTTNYACVIQDIKSGQILTVKAANLPEIDIDIPTDKINAIETLCNLFDPSRVVGLSIRKPFTDRGPLTFNARMKTTCIDDEHPYLIIQYKNRSSCLALPCSSNSLSPHTSPMKMLVLDGHISESERMWDKDMKKLTIAYG